MTRQYGSGSVFFDHKRGCWVGNVSFKSSLNGKRVRRAVLAATKTEAREKMEALKREASGGRPIPNGSLRVGAFLDKWIEETIRPQSRSVNTLDNYRRMVDLHIKPALGTKRLRDLSPDDVNSLLVAKLDAGYSHSTVTRLRTILVKSLRHGERFGYVGRNVAQLVELPRAPRRQGRSMTVEQAKALLEAARGERLEGAIACGLMLGLRPGEVLGLCWMDVDLEKGILSVRRSLIRERNQLRLGDTKTPQSVRSLEMPSELVDLLMRHRARQARERLAAGGAWSDHDVIFATEVGTLTDPSNLRRVLDRICAKADLGHWSPNELRHSFASLLSHSGVPLDRVADAMGHADTRMTSAVYRHRLAPTISEAAGPMEQMLGGSATRSASGS